MAEQIKKMGEFWGVYLVSGVFVAGLGFFVWEGWAEPKVTKVVDERAVEIADSVVSEKLKPVEHNQKVILNYLRLQNDSLYRQAKQLEED